MIKTSNLVVAGFGRVGRAFSRLIEEKAPFLEKRYGLRLFFRAILKSDGGLFSSSPVGLNKLDLNAASSLGLSCHPLWTPGLNLSQIISLSARLTPTILVLATHSSLKTGEPGLSLAEKALDAGWHVVTADKAPLVVRFPALEAKANQNRLALKFSGAAAAALPALDIGCYCLAGAEITEIEGILNGTSNFILTEMSKGRSYKESLAEAKAKGIAEPDPSLDVEGWDTAIKLLLIGRAVMDANLSMEDIPVEGIASLCPDFIVRLRLEGKSIKLIGRIERKKDCNKIRAWVRPQVLEPGHPLYSVDGTNKAITFWTDTMGSITVSGGKSDPRGAAAALLKDILHISH
ncbi:MAG: homoserine dehydrogenase [Candidatus Aminicenantales bacterium]